MKSLVFIGWMLFCPVSLSQEVLTLQACLDQLQIHLPQTTVEWSEWNKSKINRKFHVWTLLPDLTGNIGLNTSFGRRLDPFTNTFATTSVNSQTFGLNSNVKLFGGCAYFYQRDLLNIRIQRNEISWNAKLNEQKIQLIETYLSLCKLAVQIRLAEARIETYKQIQKVQQVLLNEGRISVIDTLKSHQSLLAEQVLCMDLANESKLVTIRLNFQMGMPLRTTHTVDFASISEVKDKLDLSEKFQVKVLEMELKLAEIQSHSDRAKVLPSISLNGLIGTGFSTNNKDYSLAGAPTKLYSSQIYQNLYEGIGLYLNIPLFNRGEWLKTKHLNALEQTELTNRKLLADQLLAKEQLELEQKRLNQKAKLDQTKQIADNLQHIYNKSLLLYQAGRITYTEIEAALLEWQMKLIDYELIKMDHETLKIYE